MKPDLTGEARLPLTAILLRRRAVSGDPQAFAVRVAAIILGAAAVIKEGASPRVDRRAECGRLPYRERRGSHPSR
jgi:hypothetical protein